MSLQSDQRTLSIIIPAYNARPHLAQGLQDLVKQADHRVEILVVDDGSTDGTGDQARAVLAKQGDGQHCVITQPNRGVSAARNAGLQRSCGEYVLFLDADDRLHDGFLKIFLTAVLDHPADGYVWRCRVLAEGKWDAAAESDSVHWEATTGTKLLEEIILKGERWYPTGTAAWRRELLIQHNLEYKEGCACGEDQEMTLKVLSFARTVLRSDAVFMSYMKRAGSAMRSCSWGRFDVVFALKRLEVHFRSLQEPWALPMADEVGGPRLLSNFFLNLKSCYRQAGAPEPRSWLAELYEHHPGLPEILRPLLLSCPGLDKRLRWEARLFRIAPYGYLRRVGKRSV